MGMSVKQPVHPGQTRREACLSPAQHAGYTAREMVDGMGSGYWIYRAGYTEQEMELLARGVFLRACDATRQGERMAHWGLGLAALVGVPVILWVVWNW